MKRTLVFLLFFIYCIATNTEVSAKVDAKITAKTGAKSGGELSKFHSEAISAYQNKNYEQSSELFAKALQLQPNNPNLAYNFGLSQYQLKKKGYALALWRKALSLTPLSSKAQSAIDFAKKDLSKEAFRQPSGTWPFLQSRLILPLPLDFWLGCSLFFFFFSTYGLIKYFGKRKIAFEQESSLPSIPYLSALFMVLFVIALTSSTFKALSLMTAKGTIITQYVDVRTGPNDQENTIFKLSEGFEVYMLSTKNNWTLIKYYDGIQGWIPNSALIQTHGSSL